MKLQIFQAPLLSPRGHEHLWHEPQGALAVDEEGRILAAGTFESVMQAAPEAPVQDVRPCWILPGLVDLHTHLPQFGAAAMDGLELLPWLETHIYPAEARFSDPRFAAHASRIFFQDLLSLGTTTAAVYSSVHAEATDIAFEEAEKAGLRVILGKVMMDRHVPPSMSEATEASLEQSEELCQRWHGRDHGRLQYAFSPRFAPACSPELMHRAGALAEKYGAYIQTHLAESHQELAWVKRLFPSATNYTEVYHHAGLLGPRTLLGHGIHLDPRERAVINESKATLVHCPRANAFLKSGAMPLSRWLDEGLRVGLGTDVGAGPSLSLWAEMAFACQTSKLRSALLEDEGDTRIDPMKVFHMATLGGARALGMQNRIGSLEPGKDADFIVVDPRFVEPGIEAEDTHSAIQVLSRLMYREDPRMVQAAYVRGRRCHVRAD